MPDMNNHTIEGLRAQRDALLAALKNHDSDQNGLYHGKKDTTFLGCDYCATIATIEGLPKDAPVKREPNPFRAFGKDLDFLGTLIGLTRESDESDDGYRKRLLEACFASTATH